MRTPEHLRSAVSPRPWTSAPWTIWAYGVIQLLAIVIYVVVQDVRFGWGGLLLEILIFVGLLHGVRVAWIVATLFVAIGIVGSVSLISSAVDGEENVPLVASQVSSVLLTLIALLHPRTRAWTRPRWERM